MTTYTHKIISMKRGETSNSASPMWRCVTKDGEKVNVFKHQDPRKNSFGLFGQYHEELERMVLNQEVTWKECPIEVDLSKDGQWWNIVAVAPRPQGSHPDADNRPSPALYKDRAIHWANALVTEIHSPVVIWDTETSGLDDEAEIISIAATWNTGDQILNTFIRPQNPGKLMEVWGGQIPSQIHGLTPDLLQNAPTFPEIYPTLARVLNGAIWVIYNAQYDTGVLTRNCLRHGLEPLYALGINDAMELFAQFNGEWNPVYKHFVSKKLEVACNERGIQLDNAHTAMADTRATLALLESVAAAIKNG